MARNTVGFAMVQSFKRIAFGHPPLRDAARRVEDHLYLLRRSATARGGRTTGRRAEVEEELVPFRMYRERYADVAGYFRAGAMASWDVLLSLQAAMDVRGDLMEIGVLRGKSATLMALHARDDERVVLVDPALLREATDAVTAIHPRNTILIREPSQSLAGHEALRDREGSMRWIHIDGEHSGAAVRNDLEIACTLLSRRGVICLDDFFAPEYPQVTFAALSMLERQRDNLQAFLIGFNKGYLCRPEAAQFYLGHLKDRGCSAFEVRGIEDVTFHKTSEPDDLDCFGVTKRRGPFRYKGPDWAPGAVPMRR